MTQRMYSSTLVPSGLQPVEHAARGIAEIGDRIERDVGYGLAEHDVKNEQVIDRRERIADRAREGIGGLDRKTRAEQTIVERHVSHGDRARRGMPDDLADAEIFEEIAGTGLRHESHHRCWSAPAHPAPLCSRS